MATFYLDFENGNDSNDGLSFANRWKTITSGATAARTAPGDTIRIMKSPDPVSLGVNGTFTKQSPTITLASAVTANISTCQAAWTASANVTTNTSSTRKEGTVSVSIAPTAAFTTGVLAYEATGTLDLSAYQNVSLWLYSSVNLSANALRLDLCTDTAGATPAHSFTIDTAFTAAAWKPITFKNGSALNSAIKSVALTALTDFGAATILIDNIIATNDLHFNSLIGTSSSATGQIWYPLRSINGTTVIIGNDQRTGPADASARGWHDTTTTTTAYVRDCIRITSQQTTNEGGSAASGLITYSGGWDRTNMSAQNGLTFVYGDRNIFTGAIINRTQTYLGLERIGTLWGNNALSVAGYNRTFNCGIYGCAMANGEPQANGVYLESYYAISNASSHNWTNPIFGVDINIYSNSSTTTVGGGTIRLRTVKFYNNNGNFRANSALFMQNYDAKDNSGYAMGGDGRVEINGFTASGNAQTFSTINGTFHVNNLTSTDSTIFAASNSILSQINLSRYSTYSAYSISEAAVISDVNTPLHGTSSRSFAHTPLANTSTYIPVIQPLQPFAVGASTLVTFKIWVRRTSTNVEGRVRLKGYVTPGVGADVTATITAAINTWEELTVTCTPSAAGVVQIDLESYSVNGSTGTVYFGDATVSQA